MKMVALPCVKQYAIHRPAVNAPTDLTSVCTILPRLPSQIQMIPMKLKRKLCYKGHYMYQYVRPSKVLTVLQWLKSNNPLYKDIEINSDWLSDAAQDDSDLWEALSARRCPLPPTPSLTESTSGSLSLNCKLQCIVCALLCVCVCVCVCVYMYVCMCIGELRKKRPRHGAKKRWRDVARANVEAIGASEKWNRVCQDRKTWFQICCEGVEKVSKTRLASTCPANYQTQRSNISCDCGRSFRRQGDLTRHKRFCSHRN